MKFRDHEYYQASLERIQQARKLYQLGNAYAPSMYCSGLAVECLLRAFRWRSDPVFDGRHDLDVLLKSCGIMQQMDLYAHRKGTSDTLDDLVSTLRGAMNDVVILRDNCLRFTSEARLKAYLRDKGKVQGLRGNPCRKNAADLLEAAQLVIDRGVLLWT